MSKKVRKLGGESINEIVEPLKITDPVSGVSDLSLYRQRKALGYSTKIISKKGRQLIVLTDVQIVEVEELAARMTSGEIARHFGISRRTFYDIRNRQSEVDRAYKKGNITKILYVSNLLMRRIEKGCTSSIIFFLKTQAGWRPGMDDEQNAKFDRELSEVESLDEYKMSAEEKEEFELWKQERSKNSK